MSFHFKNIGLTINHTESKMFDRKNLTCGNRGTGRKVLKKKIKKKRKDKKIRGEDAWEKQEDSGKDA